MDLMNKKLKKTIPGHKYKISFGVIQAENIGNAANLVNETPRDFIKKSTLDNAEAIIAAANLNANSQ